APHETAKPKQAAIPEPAPKLRAAQVDKPEKKVAPAPERELRTAYSAPPASTNGLLSGAQPVVPAGTFDSRFSGLR
ncbi:MAG: hypothetical protein ABI830_12945, partial [Pseudolabrys sp.]